MWLLAQQLSVTSELVRNANSPAFPSPQGIRTCGGGPTVGVSVNPSGDPDAHSSLGAMEQAFWEGRQKTTSKIPRRLAVLRVFEEPV